MTITSLFSEPFYEGGAVSSLVPGQYNVSLAGRPYMLDLKPPYGPLVHQSIPLLRQQSDDSGEPGEASINPEDLWRRSQDSWHHGAGQTFLDRSDSDSARFHASKGIDVWERWQLSLLPDVDAKRSSASTNLALAVAGSRLYLADDDDLFYTTDVTVDSPTWNAVTDYTGGDILSLTSDGFTVYLTDGTNVWTTNTGVTTATSYNTLDADLLAYVKGRLMAAHENSIYNITSGSAPSALFSQANTDFEWVGFAEGQANIYAAGFSGDKSLIYRIAVKPDATALDQPVVAGELPDGEIVRSIGGYLGNVFVGTDKGVRFCLADGQGNLQIGALIETGQAVRCFEGQESFVWFGWTNYDADSTGLGRLDLRVITDPAAQTLAYASDLMVTGSGNVLSVVTFQNIRVFTISGLGVYAQDTALVASGTIDSGLISYGLPDLKTALLLDVRYGASFAGTHKSYVAADGETFTLVGTHPDTSSDNSGDEFPVGQLRAERFEIREELDRGSPTTTGPTLTRHTLKANPAAEIRDRLLVPLLLHTEVYDTGGAQKQLDVAFELENIKALRSTRQVVTYQEFLSSYSVFVEDYEWRGIKVREDGKGLEGTCVVALKTL